MMDLSLVIRTLYDVMRSGELSETSLKALEWVTDELKTPPSGSPWTSDRGQIRDKDGDAIASIPYSLGGMTDEANRRLILAAPVLLEAAQEALQELGLDVPPSKRIAQARDVLHRAVYIAKWGADPEQTRAEEER